LRRIKAVGTAAMKRHRSRGARRETEGEGEKSDKQRRELAGDTEAIIARGEQMMRDQTRDQARDVVLLSRALRLLPVYIKSGARLIIIINTPQSSL